MRCGRLHHGDLPEALRSAAEMYAGCVSGAVTQNVFLKLIRTNGFENIKVQKEKQIHIPADILKNYLDNTALEKFIEGNSGIFIITVSDEKAAEKKECCGSDCC